VHDLQGAQSATDCKAQSARTAEIRDAFVRAHAQCARGRNGRQTVLEEFTMGPVANDAQLKIMKSDSIELLMQFIASSHLSFRRAGGWPFWNVIHPAMELAQAACAGRSLRTFFRMCTARLWRGSSFRSRTRGSTALRITITTF
jgi:hypothetical protein